MGMVVSKIFRGWVKISDEFVHRIVRPSAGKDYNTCPLGT